VTGQRIGEDWEQVLRREMLEEACAQVLDARLLGFARSECLGGHEDGLILVRSIWLARVEVLPWEPQFEIPLRRLEAAGTHRGAASAPLDGTGI